jgi:hypothetical protein
MIVTGKSIAADAVALAHPNTQEVLEEEQQEEVRALGTKKP